MTSDEHPTTDGGLTEVRIHELIEAHGKENLIVLFRGTSKNGEQGLWWTDDLLEALDYAYVNKVTDTPTTLSENLLVTIVTTTQMQEMLANPDNKVTDYTGFRTYRLWDFVPNPQDSRTLHSHEVVLMSRFFTEGNINGSISDQYASQYSKASFDFSRQLILSGFEK